MKTPITLGQIQIDAGQPEKNLSRALEMIRTTTRGGMVVLPEMAIPGYMIGDMWLRDGYVHECEKMDEDIMRASLEAWVAVVWWNIVSDPARKNEDGSMRKYNAVHMAADGKLLGTRYKTLLPNYRMFDDKRYFTSAKQFMEEEGILPEEYYRPIETIIDGVSQKVSLLICEDIWNINGDYDLDPVTLTKLHGPDIIAVASASPFGIDKAKFRSRLLERQSQGTRLVYVNPTGIQNNGKNVFAFDGGSAEYDDGKFVRGIQDYTSDTIIDTIQEKSEMEQVYETLTYTIREFVKSIGDKKVVIGLSGGIDSGLVAALLVAAIGPDRVIAVNMPSNFNSDTTKGLAKELADTLGIQYLISPIQSIVDEEIRVIRETTGQDPTSFDIENIQARTRGIRLAGISANMNAIFTNNGNKDEVATGYATLYGDVNGAIAIIGDLHKEQVRVLSHYINVRAGKEIIPEAMISLKPSAELSATQNPEQGGGDPFEYTFLGRLTRAFQEKKKMPEDILGIYEDGALESFLGIENLSEIFPTTESFVQELEKIWKLRNITYFKRIQSPPTITLSRASYGFDYREAQNEVYFTRNYYETKARVLKKK